MGGMHSLRLLRVPLRSWAPVVYCMALACAILGPLMGRGYVLTLDMVFGPHIAVPSLTTATWPLYALLSVLQHVLPVDVLQKVLLFGTFFGAGYGMFRLFQALVLAPARGTPAVYTTSALFAGTVYAVNPFVYSRYMAGQYLVLLGYALLPFALRAWRRFLMQADVWRGAGVVLWVWALGCVSLHMLGIAGLAGAALFVHALYSSNGRAAMRQLLWRVGLVAVAWLLISAFWVVPLVLGAAPTAHTIQGFTPADMQAFKVPGSPVSVALQVATMRGFWADAQDMYVLPQDVYSWWWLPICLLAGLAAYGVYYGWRTQRSLSVAIAVAAVAGAVLAGAVGVDSWLAAHIPLFAGYRDAQKYVALVALAYAYFGGMGCMALAARMAAVWRGMLVVLFAVPLLTAPLLYWGAAGQLTVRHYPADWQIVQAYLMQNSADAPVVLLPWHMYMRYDFAGRVIANPVSKFFTVPTVTSADPEFRHASSYAANPATTTVDTIMHTVPQNNRLGRSFAIAGVRYVALAKTFDYTSYQYLDRQQDMHRVLATANWVVYKVDTE